MKEANGMNRDTLKSVIISISEVMDLNRINLNELDLQNGNLGSSVYSGFKAAALCLDQSEERDLGRLLIDCSAEFNEAAPSTIGAVLAFGMMGMAKALKGSEEAKLPAVADAMQAGVDLIMEKAKSAPGEGTILDALCPAVTQLRINAGCEAVTAFANAEKIAANGADNTRKMPRKHGAPPEGDGAGLPDGGAIVGRLIFEGINVYFLTVRV